MRVVLALITQREDVHKLHEGQELLVTFTGAFQEFQLELLLQVAERLINILIPPIHEPRGPYVRGLKLIKVPSEHFTNFVFLGYYLINRHRVIS
jgi:hypothetical protein